MHENTSYIIRPKNVCFNKYHSACLDCFKHVVSQDHFSKCYFHYEMTWAQQGWLSQQEGMCSSSVVCGFKASVFVKRTDARSSYGLLKRGPAPPSHWCTSTIRHAPLPLFHRTRPSSRHTRNKQGSVFCSSVMWKRQSYFLSPRPHTSPAWPLWEEKLKTNCRLLIWYLIYSLPSV